ncbi:MAG TPA: SPOR domain-containing protein [Steroidobacteraceae bacterium]|nr:SPOR domain-containing protein [Steroidobacteraceae bacterium]
MAAGRCICSADDLGSGAMEENTSKVRVAGDANLAAAALLQADGQGTSLFVINLCASMAPVTNVAKTLPGFETLRLYQVARREDGRTRYRLRLGFFTSEADAEAALNSVRSEYPTAFTACLCDEDRKFTRGFVPDISSVPAPKPVNEAPKIAMVVDNKPAAKAEPIKSAAAPKPAPIAKAATTDTVSVKALSPKNEPKTDTVTVRTLTPKADAKPQSKASPTPAAKTDTVTVKALTPATTPTAPTAKPAPSKPVAAVDAAKPQAAPQIAPVEKAKVAAPASTALSDEFELSWDPPALQPSADAGSAPAQVIAASFKTQDVIKAPAPAVNKAAPKHPEAPKPIAAKPTPAATPAPATSPKKDIIGAPSKLLAAIELTLESEPTTAPAPAKPAAAVSNEPFRVGKGIEIPSTSLSLQSEAAAPTAAPVKAPVASTPAPAAPIAATAAKPTADVSKMKSAQASAPAAIKAAVTPQVRKVDGPAPDLDSTQTIRALTSDELNDDSQEKYFAIQLAVSDQPVNLDAMPRLDIFEAYRLYSVASAGSGKITHALRLGFFREDHSAEAVSGYLKTFFNSPTVVRISIAEQARFKDAPAPRPAPKGEGKVLDLSHARDRAAPKVVPTVTMEVETKKFDPMATGSFKANATGAHKALATGAHTALNATGTHKSLNATGTHKSLSATGTHPSLGATGTHKALKPAAKSATPPTKRSQPLSKSAATGRHKALEPKKSLSQQLMDEAREVELSQSGIRKLPKNDSLFSKMFGKKK